jgi:3D (Asp-Asp-Asp) domain-containing protein
MKEEKILELTDALWTFACLCVLLSLTYLFAHIKYDKSVEFEDEFTPMDFVTPIPQYEWWNDIPKIQEPIENKHIEGYYETLNTINSIDTGVLLPKTEYLGKYFVTAYCPEECGWSWSTSSGATCHYSENPYEPTTCAIDRSVHGYNELLMIEGKIYITEDTGPGVRGHWVDCFVETMDEVKSWNTGYKSVYSVRFIQEYVTASERTEIHEHRKYNLLYELWGDHLPYQNEELYVFKRDTI